jgi:hypothetical protein
MPQLSLDRFGRLVIPRAVRQRHGWRAGTVLELREGPDGLVQLCEATATAPPGWAWDHGLLIALGQADGDLDVAKINAQLEQNRDSSLGGI